MKNWTKKADEHFAKAREHMMLTNYYLHELADELKYRPSEVDATSLQQQMLDEMNKLAREKIWPFYKKHQPESYARMWPNGPDWEKEAVK